MTATTTESLVALDDAAYDDLRILATAKAEIKALKKLETELTARIKSVIGESDGATYNGDLVATVSLRAGARRCDYDGLLAAYPEAYQDHVDRNDPASVLGIVSR